MATGTPRLASAYLAVIARLFREARDVLTAA